MDLLSKNTGASKTREHGFLLAALSFIIPFILILLAFVALHIAPFGNHNIAISDGTSYVYDLPSFKELLTGNESWLYSFHSLGSNRWSSLSWGGIAVAKVLTLFSSQETAPYWLGWITIVNLSLCGLTMYLLLSYIRGRKWSNLIFSTSYALIGFSVVNCYQILFFIGPQALPLMVLGLIRLMRGKSPLPYILSLGACIFFNFYFGFQLCVASLVFFLAYMYVEKENVAGRKLRLFFKWFGSSVIAGLLPAFFWLPAIKAFTGGGRIEQTAASEYSFGENMPFLQIFSKLFSGANSTDEMVNGLPNIFCGILTVALVVLFFMNAKISKRRKRAAGAVMVFYLLTFYITAFTLVMHGGTHTNWFPFRYSYVFSFILIYLASEEFEYVDELTLKDTKKCGIGLLIAAILVFYVNYGFISGGSVLLDFAILILMWLGFRLYKTKPSKAPKKVLSILLLILTCINLYVNFVISIYKVQDWELDLEEYQENVLQNGALIDAIKIADTGFYRLEKDESDLGSVGADPSFYDYYGVSGSGPAIRSFVHKELCRLGINWFDMRHWYSEGIPAATDTLLGLKYLLSDRDLEEEKGYEARLDVNGTGIYLNDMALSVAVLADKEAYETELSDNVFENLNTVFSKMAGDDRTIFTPQENVTFTGHSSTTDMSFTSEELKTSTSVSDSGEKAEGPETESYIEYSFTAEKDGPVYVFDTSTPSSSSGLPIPSIKCCGVYKKGDAVKGYIAASGGEYITSDLVRGYCVNQVYYYADNDALRELATILNDRDITFNLDERTAIINGEYSSDEGKRIILTIPWDEGWTCRIDGKTVPIDKTWDLFMSVDAPEGEHTYEFSFFPAWMNYGIIISCAALVALIAWMTVLAVKRKKNAECGTVNSELTDAEDNGRTADLPVADAHNDAMTENAGDDARGESDPDDAPVSTCQSEETCLYAPRDAESPRVRTNEERREISLSDAPEETDLNNTPDEKKESEGQ